MVKFTHVSAEEEALMKKWHGEGLCVKKIGKLLSRGPTTISKHIFKRHPRRATNPVGRPRELTGKCVEKIVSTRGKMLAEAKGEEEVTLKMVKARMRLKCSEKAMSRSVEAKGIRFRPLYETPGLTDADEKERLRFAEHHKHRTGRQWAKVPHAVIDDPEDPRLDLLGVHVREQRLGRHRRG